MKNKYEEANAVFFISPIGSEESTQRHHSDMLLTKVLRPVFSKHGLNVIRAEEIADKPDKIDEIYEMLRYAPIMIADLYQQTPNVMHEIGIALAWGRVPILIAPKDIEILPFDLRQLSYIPYSPDIGEPSHTHDIQTLKDEIEKRIINSRKDENYFTYSRVYPMLQNFGTLGVKVDALKEDIDKIETLISKKFNGVDADLEKTRKELGSQVENILSLLKAEEKSFNAVFIEGENDAFSALTEAVNRAKKLVKTTRFSPYSVVNRHDEFFVAIQQAAGRLNDRLFRIIAVNSHEKLKEANQLVANNVGKKLTIVLTNVEYSFEIVVIDDEEAFIHFRRADQPNVLIASTLHVQEKLVASEFSEIFNQITKQNAIKVIECDEIDDDTVAATMQEIVQIFSASVLKESQANKK